MASKQTVSHTFHDITWTDDYAWLRADNWQEAMREPEQLPAPIKAYLESENRYCAQAMEDCADLQSELISEMRGRILERDRSVPEPDGPYAYGDRYDEGAEHPVYFRTARSDAKGREELLIDINIEAQQHEYFDHGLIEHSPDHKTLAWSCDTNGAEYYRLFFRDVETGKDSDVTIEDVESITWADANNIFYTRVDKNHRANKVFRHTLGSDASDDVLVFHETDERFYCDVYTSRSGSYVFITSNMNDQDEVRFIPVARLDAIPEIIEPRAYGLEYSVDHRVTDGGDEFVILNNTGSAADFKLSTTPVRKPGKAHWQDFQPYQAGCMIHDFEVLKDWVIWLAVENALPAIYYCKANGVTSKVAFDEEAYSLGVDAGLEFQVNSFRFDYASPSTPWQTWEYDLNTGDRVLLKTQEIPSGHSAEDYVVRRIAATSHDGAKVPVTLMHHRNTPIDGTAPCLLYGYGAYGSSVPAGFSSNRLSLVDRGFVYAIAHVRGGEEKGRDWYEQAKRLKKINSFEDMIAAANTLIENKYTGKQRIVLHGGSAGGLLVGATVNMQPELFAGVIADVPFVDVLNTMIDDTLPLTPGEWSQWGNPIEDPEAFKAMQSYSPYDNVSSKAYPAMLVTAGVSDPRVTYWEPAKWVARLRDLKTDDNPLLLKTNMSSGHFGKTGRFAMLEDYALSFAFALAVT